MAAKKTSDAISIPVIKQGQIKIRLIGQTPMYFNSMSAKAKRDLLVGAGRKTAAEKKEIKHNPEQPKPKVTRFCVSQRLA